MQMKNEIMLIPVRPKKFFGRGKWKVAHDAVFHGHLIPEGFVSSGTSAPRILCAIIPVTGHALKSSILHDYRLKNGSRDSADISFRDVMILDEVPKIQRAMFYYSARIVTFFVYIFEPVINAVKWLIGK